MPKTDMRIEVADWLTSLGINPHDVPVDSDLTISDGALHYEAFVRDADGNKIRDERGTHHVIERRSVPLTVDPPEHWQPYEKPTREQLQELVDGAYRERAHLVAWLAAMHESVIAPAPDVDEPGWQIVYVYAGGWQMSWHISPRDAELFKDVKHVAAEHPRAQWDGHQTDQKYARIRNHTRVIHMNERLGNAVDNAIPPAIDRAIKRDHSLCGIEPCSDCR